jgi:hypothetical protein
MQARSSSGASSSSSAGAGAGFASSGRDVDEDDNDEEDDDDDDDSDLVVLPQKKGGGRAKAKATPSPKTTSKDLVLTLLSKEWCDIEKSAGQELMAAFHEKCTAAVILDNNDKAKDKENYYYMRESFSRLPELLRWVKVEETLQKVGNKVLKTRVRAEVKRDDAMINLSERTTLQCCYMVMDANEYMNLVFADTGSSSWCADYPSLNRLVDQYQRTIDSVCPKGTIWGLVFVNRDHELVKRQKKKSASDKDQLREQVEDADMFLRIEKNVAIHVVKNVAELGEWVCSINQSMAKAIKSWPYTELDFVGSKKMEKPPAGTSVEKQELLRLQHNWRCILATIPGIGETQAKAIAATYTCPRRLLDAYWDSTRSVQFKKDLLCGSCAQSNWKGHGPPTDVMRRRSERVYHALTSLDPGMMIADDED